MEAQTTLKELEKIQEDMKEIIQQILCDFYPYCPSCEEIIKMLKRHMTVEKYTVPDPTRIVTIYNLFSNLVFKFIDQCSFSFIENEQISSSQLILRKRPNTYKTSEESICCMTNIISQNIAKKLQAEYSREYGFSEIDLFDFGIDHYMQPTATVDDRELFIKRVLEKLSTLMNKKDDLFFIKQ